MVRDMHRPPVYALAPPRRHTRAVHKSLGQNACSPTVAGRSMETRFLPARAFRASPPWSPRSSFAKASGAEAFLGPKGSLPTRELRD